MNKSAFLKLIQQVSNISDQQTEELEKVAAAFPYCQTAHLLLAKSAHDKGSMLSAQRLRKASAYATDRQLLKHIIYAVPEPVLEKVEAIEAVPSEVESITNTEPIVEEPTDNYIDQEKVILEKEVLPEPEKPEEEKDTTARIEVFETVELPEHELQLVASTETVKEDTEEETEEVDAELAMLLTINSLSPSSTDLLADYTAKAQQEQASSNYLHETGEALTELSLEDQTTADTFFEKPQSINSDTYELASKEDITQHQDLTAALSDNATQTTSITLEEETTEKPEDAAVNYSFDEIDRMYFEDSLGYAMGSSRMGEVLQIKDEYTRPRPQSFHPELILEYSKTHEIEKAVQPANNSLSEQLDIIDQFLKLNPRLKTMANIKLKPEPQEDLSLRCTKIKKGMASESLANIFLKQGKIKKAIKIYEQLMLKYPEKKAYFAEQIEKLQNIT